MKHTRSRRKMRRVTRKKGGNKLWNMVTSCTRGRCGTKNTGNNNGGPPLLLQPSFKIPATRKRASSLTSEERKALENGRDKYHSLLKAHVPETYVPRTTYINTELKINPASREIVQISYNKMSPTQKNAHNKRMREAAKKQFEYTNGQYGY